MKPIKKTMPCRSFHGNRWHTMLANKKRLMNDFNHKCAYCDDFDRYCGGPGHYHVDHFAPKQKFNHLKYEYSNMLYSCPFCNRAKSDKWVGRNEHENVINEKGFIDPCTTEYELHLHRNDDGSIVAKTNLGEYMRNELKLYLVRHQINYMIEEISMKRLELKRKCEDARACNLNPTKLEVALGDISSVLCDYYELLHDEEQFDI